MRLAVLDLGSNTFQMAMYRQGAGGRPDKLGRRRIVLRLGASLKNDGRIPNGAARRALDAVDELVHAARRADRVVAVATAALRDAKNGAELCDAIRRRHGFSIELLSGTEEACLGYVGAGLGLARAASQRATIELGGGSAQIAAGDGRIVRAACSLPIGVLRLHTLSDDMLRARVRASARIPLRSIRAQRPQQWILSGGSARRLGRLAVSLGFERAGAATISRESIIAIGHVLRGLDHRDLDALGIEAARHDTIRPGVLALATLLESAGVDVATISAGGLREGVAYRELGGRIRTGELRAVG